MPIEVGVQTSTREQQSEMNANHRKDEALPSDTENDNAAIISIGVEARGAASFATITPEQQQSPAPPQQQHQQQQSEQRGILRKLFRPRKKAQPTSGNGEVDLLDDDRPDEESTKYVSEEGGGENEEEEDDAEEEEDGETESYDDEQNNRQSSEDEDKSDSEDDSQEDIPDENDSYHQQRQNTTTSEEFGRFNETNDREEGTDDDDENAEFASLIGSGSARPTTKISSSRENQRKRGFIGRLFGRNGRSNNNRGGADETKGLLGYNDTDDDDDDDDDAESAKYRDGDQIRQKGLVKSSDDKNDDGYESDNNSDDQGDEEDSIIDDHTDHGDSRSRSMYYDNNEYPYATPGNQELNGRIKGYGSGSAALHSSNCSYGADGDGSARYYDAVSDPIVVSSRYRDFDPDMEKKGLFHGVGKVVSNIFGSGIDSEDDRKKMVAYIDELEWRLRQKDIELQSWKSRSEQLEKELNRLCGKDSDYNVEDEEVEEANEEEESEEEGDAYEAGDDSNEKDKYDLLMMDDSESPDDDNIDKTAGEGTFIDMSEATPVFDPLSNKNARSTNKIEKANDALKTKQNQDQIFGEIHRHSQQIDEPSSDHDDKLGEVSWDANMKTINTDARGAGEGSFDTETYEQEKHEVDVSQYQFLSAISRSSSPERPTKNVVTP